jgi:hypothetical protein
VSSRPRARSAAMAKMPIAGRAANGLAQKDC